MKIRKHFINFWQTFFHTRVVVFIFIGAGIIFLTFLTRNNALEISISGVASVFIGIGVNNFSMLETREKDQQKLKAKMLHYINTLEFIRSRISSLEDEAGVKPTEKQKQELTELEQLINTTIHLMNGDDLLN
jgi:ABC-type uncharacterized transport system permease subunit